MRPQNKREDERQKELKGKGRQKRKRPLSFKIQALKDHRWEVPSPQDRI